MLNHNVNIAAVWWACDLAYTRHGRAFLGSQRLYCPLGQRGGYVLWACDGENDG